MSVKMMSQVWDLDLATTEKMVLLILADHGDDDGQNAWPSISRIARKASISERQVQRTVAALQEMGFVKVEKQAGGTRGMRDDRRPNLYSIRLDGVTSTTSRNGGSRGDIETPRGDTHVANGVTPMSPKPSLEPPTVEPPIAEPAASATETDNQRANRLAKVYTDLQPMSRFPAIAGIVRKAIAANHSDEEISAALTRLATEGRSVTVETLRVELEGMPPSRAHRPSGTEMYLGVASTLSQAPDALQALEASR
jgi:hypothetical protein